MSDYQYTVTGYTVPTITTSSTNPYIYASPAVVYDPITISSTRFTVSTGTLHHYEPKYKCQYCDTVHDHRTGVCDRCGAPLGEAVEV